MSRQIQKIKQTQKNHTNPSRTHKSTHPKKLYKPRNQTHKKKNHKRILYKKKKNQSTYIHKPNYPKENRFKSKN